MKFGETFMEYLHRDGELCVDKISHVEYKQLKKVLKSCRCKSQRHSLNNGCEDSEADPLSEVCELESCSLCDQLFFSELKKEALDIKGCFCSRAKHLLHLHSSGFQGCVMCFLHCFKTDQQVVAHEGRMLIEYAMMNAVAIRKILKKYDKVHGSVSGRNFKSRMGAEHIELLQSPWIIELGAFYFNMVGSEGEEAGIFSCDFDASRPVMTLLLPDSQRLEYSLTCAVCLDIIFKPYALRCGHLFCKPCACSSAEVLIFQGLKAARPESRCPVCREEGVYEKVMNMVALDVLVRKRCKGYWKERLVEERAESARQSKEYWDSQTKAVLGY